MQFEIGENEIYLKGENDKKVAYVCFEKQSNSACNIAYTYVDEALRGKGVANAMLEFLMKYLKSIGVNDIHATCTFAQRWLEKNNT